MLTDKIKDSHYVRAYNCSVADDELDGTPQLFGMKMYFLHGNKLVSLCTFIGNLGKDNNRNQQPSAPDKEFAHYHSASTRGPKQSTMKDEQL